jgi:hypothetical protein
MEVEVRVLGIDPGLQVCGYACLEADDNRGRCPRTLGILRFWPAAWLKSKAMPPRRRHRPCHWTAEALGVLAGRALSSPTATPEYLQHPSAARGQSNTSLMRMRQAFDGGFGAPRRTSVLARPFWPWPCRDIQSTAKARNGRAGTHDPRSGRGQALRRGSPIASAFRPHPLMLLAQSGKCRGLGGRAPNERVCGNRSARMCLLPRMICCHGRVRGQWQIQ